ncbi:pyrimidine 5'-nucleotidase [Pelomonas sp. KK5]|uniref:pyrimidine 5'-nucleotidase n=1 Tax=Pelomonas sp. KK5 TaxID=1855730 RepID=UPI00097BC66E|nr:pyrimidine 5'-nucleotidase [Pelomonas sp. KK5]
MSTVWLFDLDNTLHDASRRIFPEMREAMGAYIVRHVGVDAAEAAGLRELYSRRYGNTLLGLLRHHGVRSEHFLRETHDFAELEQWVHAHAADLAALRRLPGRKILLTNAPEFYARRVLAALKLTHVFEAVVAVEQMAMFGQLRPKPDARMFRHLLARLKLQAHRCVLVEDTLEHQKSAHALGIATVWMQRWSRGAGHPHLNRRPAYVGCRIGRLSELRPFGAGVHPTI